MGLTKKMTLAQGQRLRVTRLDNCGRPVYGDNVTAVSDGYVSVAATANTNDTDEIAVPNANGRNIIFKSGDTDLTGYGIEIVFAEVDPGVFTLVTGQPVVYDANGAAVGFGVDVDAIKVDYALEVWAGVTGGDACADEDAEGSWGYFLYPWLHGGILGDHTIENGGITFTITGANTKKGNGWGVGPYDVTLNAGETEGDPQVAGPLLVPLPTSWVELLIPVSVAPPEAVIGSRPLLNPAAADVVSITPTVAPGSYSASFAMLPDPAAGVGAWYDFGDGTWDYVETASDDVTHVYPTVAATYTAKASTNGVTWVSATVTVPGA
jgi:hypothetical protein